MFTIIQKIKIKLIKKKEKLYRVGPEAVAYLSLKSGAWRLNTTR